MAERTISTRIAVTGVDAYAQNLRDINSELRLHQSELSKVSAQYASDAGSVEALTARQKALQDVLDTEAKKVQTVRDRLADVSAQRDRYAAAVEQQRAALADLQAAQDSDSEAVREAESALKDLVARQDAAERTCRSLQIELNKAEEALAKTSNRSAALANALAEAESAAERMGREAQDAEAEVKDLGESMGKAAEETGKGSDAFGYFKDVGVSALEALSAAAVGSMLIDWAKDAAAALIEDVEQTAEWQIQLEHLASSGSVSLGDLEESFSATMGRMKADAESVLATLEALTYAGVGQDALQPLTEDIQQLSKIVGESGDGLSDLLVRVRAAYGLTDDEVTALLDDLATAHLRTGASAGSMLEQILDGRDAIQQLNLSLADAISLLGATSAQQGDLGQVIVLLESLADRGFSAAQALNAWQAADSALLDPTGELTASAGELLAMLAGGYLPILDLNDALLANAGAVDYAASQMETGAERIGNAFRRIWQVVGGGQRWWQTALDFVLPGIGPIVGDVAGYLSTPVGRGNYDVTAAQQSVNVTVRVEGSTDQASRALAQTLTPYIEREIERGDRR